MTPYVACYDASEQIFANFNLKTGSFSHKSYQEQRLNLPYRSQPKVIQQIHEDLFLLSTFLHCKDAQRLG
jgi:hypothetical protein